MLLVTYQISAIIYISVCFQRLVVLLQYADKSLAAITKSGVTNGIEKSQV